MIEQMLAIWQEIEELSVGAPGIQARPLVLDGLPEAGVLLCLQEGGVRSILLHNPGGRAALPRTGCGRLHVARQQFQEPGREPRTYIRVDCLDRDLEAPFGFLAKRIVDHLISGATPTRACTDAVRDFRRLLSRSGGPLPSDEEILGLTGELLLVDQLVRHRPELWAGWNGPTGATHDYSWGDVDIEVKTSHQAGEPRITVNGLNQLEPEKNRRLLLFHSILSSNPVGSITVPGLADGIRARIADPDPFDERLARAGYLPEQRELWEEQCFTLHEQAMYAVTDAFPRIRTSDFPDGCLPDGITRLRFDVILANASHLRLSESELRNVVTALG